ncbi:metallophosphoesterase [Lachnospira multipara]|uniref:metallophosphoesterase n=1 Tax=Lachnospira multipara TaxID=28051 RepID=UPI0003FC6C42|nr:metallophosphoesterase [Lachnospira multipara]
MGHYVVGDIHGCFDEWITLKNNIEKIDEEACFILLGDIIDRGNKSFANLKL